MADRKLGASDVWTGLTHSEEIAAGLRDERPPPIADQPPPAPTSGPAIWDLVIADMRERDAAGLARYGTRLQAGNGRDALVDAYQEALDLAVYLRQAIEERRTQEAASDGVGDAGGVR